jgi:hypothetical protein
MELDDLSYLNKGGDGIHNSQMKDKLVKEYFLRVWQILKTVKLE